MRRTRKGKRKPIIITALVTSIIWIIIGITIMLPEKSSTRVFITAAHIAEKEFPQYTKVYSDMELDYAVYLENDYKAVLPKIGTRVTIGRNIPGKITKVNTDSFVVKLDNKYIQFGLSGSVIKTLFKGTPLGYVSCVYDDGEVMCIAY